MHTTRRIDQCAQDGRHQIVDIDDTATIVQCTEWQWPLARECVARLFTSKLHRRVQFGELADGVGELHGVERSTGAGANTNSR